MFVICLTCDLGMTSRFSDSDGLLKNGEPLLPNVPRLFAVTEMQNEFEFVYMV